MPQRILVVEDTEIFQRNLVVSLRRSGFDPIGVFSGKAAWQVLSTDPIDIVLLDLGLPDVYGLDLLRQVRAVYPHVAVVVMTGQEAPTLKTQADALGALVFLKKPLSLARVREVVQAIATGRLQNLPGPCQ